MPHLAAIIPAAKAPLEVKEVETPTPGADELLVKNELIALNPIEAKVAKLAFFPITYPAILGGSYGGTVAAVGSGVTGFQVGDRVAASRASAPGNAYGAFQQYVLASAASTSRVPDAVTDLGALVKQTGNLPTVVGLVTISAGLDRPDPTGGAAAQSKKEKVLVYGGTSSVGSLAAQYVAQAGYAVVTTTSPGHAAFVARLGARAVVDHTQAADAVTKALVAAGPYALVIDAVSLDATIRITGDVLAAQGGGEIYALLPPTGAVKLPAGVTQKFGSWGAPLNEAAHAALKQWAFATYLPTAVARGGLVALPSQAAAGGLGGLNEALSTLLQGVSGVKVTVDPQE